MTMLCVECLRPVEVRPDEFGVRCATTGCVAFERLTDRYFEIRYVTKDGEIEES